MGLTLYHQGKPYKVIDDITLAAAMMFGIWIAYDCREFLWVFQMIMFVMFLISISASLPEDIPVCAASMLFFSWFTKRQLDKRDAARRV